MTIVNGHSHDSSSMHKEDLVRNSDLDLDQDQLEDAVDEVINDFSFLSEWGQHGDTRVHLDASSGEIVNILVGVCDETPEWLYPELGSHVPNSTWRDHGVNPNRRR